VNDDPSCVHCGTSWLFGDAASLYGCDVLTCTGSRFLTWAPCCEEQREAVALDGFAAAYGIELADVVQLIDPSLEVMEIIEDGDGTIVARLEIYDPTRKTGHQQCASHDGWFSEVCAEVDRHHRHHSKPQGHKFSIAIYNGGVRVGVAMVGRPVSRLVQKAEPCTLEVLRVATWGHPALRRNASSKLYAACGSRALELGYDKLITSILDEESGVSLRASGFVCVRRGKGGSWNRAARPREDKAPTGRKTVWARGLTKHTRKAVETARIDAS
jgi:hypothetical protein